MASKREEKREDLKRRLIEAAEAQIIDKGHRAIKAREVTAEAGCALGALYNAFEDLDLLILHVNSRTLGRLGAVLRAARGDLSAPEDIMQALAAAYVAFATANTNLWTSLFEHRLKDGSASPEWHRQEHAVLIEEIIAPLAALRPDLPKDRLIMRAKTTFASVHGVVQLSLQGRFVGVPQDELAAEVEALVTAMTRGTHLVAAPDGGAAKT